MMQKVKGNHGQLHIAKGDTVEVNDGPVGTIQAVQPKFSDDGIYGEFASYKVQTDDGSPQWVRDYEVTAVEYA